MCPLAQTVEVELRRLPFVWSAIDVVTAPHRNAEAPEVPKSSKQVLLDRRGRYQRLLRKSRQVPLQRTSAHSLEVCPECPSRGDHDVPQVRVTVKRNAVRTHRDWAYQPLVLLEKKLA